MKYLNRAVGAVGEEIAKEYLIKKGYKITALNYVNKIGEIDIIAKQTEKTHEIIVFIEVKMRQSLAFGYPREAVGSFKQRKIRQTAEAYLKLKGLLDSSCRFDCIEIIGDLENHTIEHLEGCF